MKKILKLLMMLNLLFVSSTAIMAEEGPVDFDINNSEHVSRLEEDIVQFRMRIEDAKEARDLSEIGSYAAGIVITVSLIGLAYFQGFLGVAKSAINRGGGQGTVWGTALSGIGTILGVSGGAYALNRVEINSENLEDLDKHLKATEDELDRIRRNNRVDGKTKKQIEENKKYMDELSETMPEKAAEQLYKILNPDVVIKEGDAN